MNIKSKSILFLCVGNSCRSQIAEGFAKNIFDESVKIQSAGTKPSKIIDKNAIIVMNEIGIDISHQYPKKLTQEMMEGVTHFISMGCGVMESCPVYLIQQEVMDWEVNDPIDHNLDYFRKVRDIIHNKVLKLKEPPV